MPICNRTSAMIDAEARKRMEKAGLVTMRLWARPEQWSSWTEKAIKAGMPLSDWIAESLDLAVHKRKKQREKSC